MRVVYLHGFASSPQSSKARFFADKFAHAGVAFEAPELDQGDFSNLTVSGQMLVISDAVAAHREKLAKGEPLVLMGSSLGGYLAAKSDAQHFASEEAREQWEIANKRQAEINERMV